MLILALFQGLFLYVHSFVQVERRIEGVVLQDLSYTMSRLQGTLEYLFRVQDYEQIQQEVSSLGQDASVLFALLVDDSNRVLASTRVADQERMLDQILQHRMPGYAADFLERLTLTRSLRRGDTQVLVTADCVSGIYPIVMGGDAGDLRPTRIGALLTCMDLGFPKQSARHELYGQIFPLALMFVLTAVLLTLLLHMVVTRRMHRLLEVTNAFAAGDYLARTAFSGKDELSRVGQAFDFMAREVASSQERLRKQSEQISLLMTSAAEAIYAVDMEGKCTFVNPACLQLLGYSEESELLGRSMAELVHAGSPNILGAEREQSRIGQALAQEQGIHVDAESLRRKDGSNFAAEYWAHRINSKGAPIGFVVTFIDITERRAAEAKLRERETRFSAIFESMYQFIGLLSPDGVMLEANKASLDFIGAESADVVGRHFWDAPWWEGEQAKRRLRAAVAQAAQGEFVRFETEHHGVDGIRINVDFSLTPIRDEAGDVVLLVPEGRNITELKQAMEESARLQDDLAQYRNHLEELVAQRTASLEASNRELEAFSYSVSHDLRSPLRAVNGYSQFLLDDYGEQLDEQARSYLQRMMAASDRMARLIDDLLKLAKVTRRELVYEEVDLSLLVRQLAAKLRERAPERVVEFIIQEGLSAKGDAALLDIMLTNLLDNAWKFSLYRSPSVIEFGLNPKVAGREFYVRDNGVGMDMAHTANLFKPFHRLHAEEEFEGTGIGLATVARIIERHQGRVWVAAEVGKGATFSFTLEAPPG